MIIHRPDFFLFKTPLILERTYVCHPLNALPTYFKLTTELTLDAPDKPQITVDFARSNASVITTTKHLNINSNHFVLAGEIMRVSLSVETVESECLFVTRFKIGGTISAFAWEYDRDSNGKEEIFSPTLQRIQSYSLPVVSLFLTPKYPDFSVSLGNAPFEENYVIYEGRGFIMHTQDRTAHSKPMTPLQEPDPSSVLFPNLSKNQERKGY